MTLAPLPRLVTHPVADPAAVVRGPGYRITVLADGLLRLERSPDDAFEDRASTLALHRRQPVPSFRVEDTGTHLVLTTDRLRLTYDRGPFTPSGLVVEVLGGVSSYHSVWRHGQAPEDLGGTARTLDGADGAVPLEPGVVSRRGYAVLDDSATPLLGDDGSLEPRAPGDRQDLYVFAYGLDHAEAVRALYDLSGPQPVLPRWALGNWWSRYHRYDAEEYAALLDRFAAAGVPFSVAVLDMDWHLTDVDPRYGSGWTGYTWDRALFPDPPAFLADLHRRGLRVTLNVHPADGVRAYEDAYAAVCTALGRDPSAGEPVAFDVTDPAFLAAYLEHVHHPREDEGVDFWWLDWQSGPYSRRAGVDPLWVLNHLHFLDAGRGGRRPLTFSRYAGPGSHRYPVGFSGDTVVSWASLAFQLEFTARAANIGYGWWSHDVGGHMFGAKDDELATRWVQLGVVSPVLRLHSSANPFMTKEPWAFGRAEEEVQTHWLRLRHRLVPWLHAMNHRAARDGVPLVTPLYHGWPAERAAYRHPAQARFGDGLLVAPVVTPLDPVSRTAAVDVWLPPGTWVDLVSGQVYDGGREAVLHRHLPAAPVLAPLGTVLPLDAAAVPADDPVAPEHVEVVVVTGADGTGALVEDDGTGDGLDETRVARTPLVWDQGTGTLRLGPARTAADTTPGWLPDRRAWTATLLVDPARVPEVRVDGVALALDETRPPATTPGRAAAEHRPADVLLAGPLARGWTRRPDEAVGTPDEPPAPGDARVTRTAHHLRVTVAPVPVGAVVEVVVGPGARPPADDVRARLAAVLDAAQSDYEEKAHALEIATGDAPLHVRLGHLAALGLAPALRGAVEDVLLASAG